jgi:hypothetical protein
MPVILVQEDGSKVPYEFSCLRGDKLACYLHGGDNYQSVVVELEHNNDSAPAASPWLLEVPNLEGGSAIKMPKERQDLVFVSLSHYASPPFPVWWFVPNSLTEDLTPFIYTQNHLIRGEEALNHLYEHKLSMGYASEIATNDELMAKINQHLNMGGAYLKQYFYEIVTGQLEVSFNETTGVHGFTPGPWFDASLFEKEDDPLWLNWEKASRHSTPVGSKSSSGKTAPSGSKSPTGKPNGTPSGKPKPIVIPSDSSSSDESSDDQVPGASKPVVKPSTGSGQVSQTFLLRVTFIIANLLSRPQKNGMRLIELKSREFEQSGLKQHELKQHELKQHELKRGESKQSVLKRNESKHSVLKQNVLKSNELKPHELEQNELEQNVLMQNGSKQTVFEYQKRRTLIATISWPKN